MEVWIQIVGTALKDNDRNAQHAEKYMQPELFEHFHTEKHIGFFERSWYNFD